MNITTEDMLFAMQQRNLVYNYNFLYYSNQTVVDFLLTFNHPDGWIYDDSGPNAEIGFDELTKSCLIQKGKDDSKMVFSQFISEFPRARQILSGKKISATAIIQNPKSASIGYELNFFMYDGISKSHKSIFLKSNEKKEINIELEVSDAFTAIELGIECSTKDAIINIEKIYANAGEVALGTLPCMIEGVIGERKQYIATETPPAEELSLCKTAEELTDSYTRLNSVLNYRFGKGANNSMLLDMRGYFSRSWNNGAGIDPDAKGRTEPGTGKIKGDNVSTFEDDVFKKHDHGLDFSIDKPLTYMAGSAPATIINTLSTSRTNIDDKGLETRPKNIAELYTIKWA